jgi:allophanate hydrolase subunit 2
VDAWSLALANRLVGNPESAAGLETSGGLMFTVDAPTMIAVTGAECDLAVADGPPLGWGTPTVLPAGATVRIGRLHTGARTYVAVRGGVERGGMNELSVGPDPGVSASAEPAAPRPPLQEIHVWVGPRLDWFVDDAWATLLGSEYVVSADSDRVGARLRGAALTRVRRDELPSEGLLEGAIQVPPDGQPIVMLADHPTTGGYPVVGIVDPADLRHVAQAPPGAALRFRPAR